MESLRKTFSFEDPEAAAAAGKPESARMAILKARLRQKQAAKSAAATSVATGAPTVAATQVPANVLEEEEEESALVNKGGKSKPKKQGRK